MRLLVLSFYYRPDLSAGSFRATALVNELLHQLPPSAHIDVITTLPNRYSSFVAGAPSVEEHARLTIHRIELPAHKSGMADQARAFLAFARIAVKRIQGREYDLVFASSSRLMTAALGAWVSRRRIPLYLDIRDIFVDTIRDILPSFASRVVGPIFSMLERLTVRSADKVNLVSAGFLPYFQTRYPGLRLSVFTNGIDKEFIESQPAGRQINEARPLNVVYAGNMGEGQGLHLIIPPLAKRFEGRLRFILIGDGGRRVQLAAAISAEGCTNVELRDPMHREPLIEAYRKADVLFLHLNSHEAFRKVLPSKLFEYAAMGKPIWAGVAGHAADFAASIGNAAVFTPCDVEDAVRVFEKLEMVTEPRVDFVVRFARSAIMHAMAQDVIGEAKRSR